MRRSLRRRLLWQGVALLCYLAGMMLFLVVGASAFFPSGGGVESIGPRDGALLLTSVALLAAGGLASWRAGGLAGVRDALDRRADRDPVESDLRSLGYEVPPEDDDDADPFVVDEDGELRARCADCGARNDPAYTYCEHCSSRLPE